MRARSLVVIDTMQYNNTLLIYKKEIQFSAKTEGKKREKKEENNKYIMKLVNTMQFHSFD